MVGRYVRIEPEIKHAEFLLRDLGLEGSKVKPWTTPGFRLDERELAMRETEAPVGRDRCYEVHELFREAVVFFPQDRADVGEPVKCSAMVYGKAYARKPQTSQRRLHAICWRTEHMALHLFRQIFPSSIIDLRYQRLRWMSFDP